MAAGSIRGCLPDPQNPDALTSYHMPVRVTHLTGVDTILIDQLRQTCVHQSIHNRSAPRRLSNVLYMHILTIS